MSRHRTAALGAACSILAAAACSTKPAGDASATTSVDTGSVSAGASAASIDSAARAAAAEAQTDTARLAAAPPAPAPVTKPAGGTTARPATATATTPAGPARTPSTTTAPAPARTPPTATKATAATTAPTAAPGTSSAATNAPAPAAAPAAAAATAQAGSVKVNKFMSYDAGAKTVTLEIIAAYNSVQGGFNFNGGSNGSHTITVPAGWQVTMHVKNVDAIPHSAIIIADQRPLPNAPDTPAIPRAYTSHVNDGLQPQTGADDLSFRASKPGKYLIYCGVPGHGPSGMFIGFVVSESATAPSYSM